MSGQAEREAFTLREHAGAVGAHVVRDGAFQSLGFVSHERIGMLVFLDDPRWLEALRSCDNVAAVITTPALAQSIPTSIAVALAEDARRTFYDLHERLVRDTTFYGVVRATQVAASARVHARAFVAAEGVVIGERVVVEPNATLHGRVILDDDVVVRAGSVLGSEGFQVLLSPGAAPRRILHGGSVHIARAAEVRANCCIDRSLFGGETTLGEECTLDHLVYVAHDVSIGQRCRIGAGVVLNGSVRIGEEVWVGPNATLSSGIRVGNRARVTLGSVVTRDVPADAHVSGNFAIGHERFLDWLRSVR